MGKKANPDVHDVYATARVAYYIYQFTGIMLVYLTVLSLTYIVSGVGTILSILGVIICPFLATRQLSNVKENLQLQAELKEHIDKQG